MARILIVNDCEDVLNFLKLVFEDHGHTVTVLLSPEAALEAAAELSPQIVFIDINMPEKNGIDLTAEFRADSRTKDQYIIVCSATDYAEDDIKKAIQAGANDFLPLPCAPVVALTRVNMALVNFKLEKENRRIRHELDFQKDLLKDLLDHTPDIIYFKDRKGRLLLVNKAHASGHGKSPDEIAGKTDFELFPYNEAEKMTIDDMFVMETRKPIIDKIEYTTRPSGQKLYVSTTKIPRFDDSGNVIGIMGVTRDITPRIQAEQAAFREKKFVSEIINSSSTPTFVIDRNHKVIYWNRACEKISGIRRRDIIGTDQHWKAFHKQKRPCLADLVLDKETDDIKKLYDKVSSVDFLPESVSVESWLENVGGKRRYLRGMANLLRDENDEVVGAIETVQDITEHKLAEEELRQSKEILSEIALKDPLTGLYNYRYFTERLTSEFKRSQRIDRPLSLVMLDVDFFKSINDAYGHHVGDKILKQIGDYLRSFCRESDIPVRFGGEEFVMLLPDTDKEGLGDFARRLSDSIRKNPFYSKARPIALSVTIGGASYPDTAIQSEQDLIKAVDDAVRKGKMQGGGRVEIYEEKGLAEVLGQEKEKNIADLKTKVMSLEKRMERSVVEFLFAFARSLEGDKYYPPHHTEKMADLVEDISKKMKLDPRAIDQLRNASVLYDIGKVCIDEKVLTKRESLSSEEYEQVKMHPRVSAEIIKDIEVFKGAVPAVLYHHERYDGKGYGFGLKGRQIPLGARILAVADAYRALVSDKPYRKAYTHEQAVRMIEEEAGRQFDPAVVKALKEAIKN